MANKETIKVIGITKNDCITGIEYGLIEIEVFSETQITPPKKFATATKPSIKQTRAQIKQPALKWANKISAAKKRMLDAQKGKQK